MQEYQVNLIVGDWSHDGHGKTDQYRILSSLTIAELEEAYAEGAKKVGFDLTDEVAVEYEDSALSADLVALLRAAGYNGTYDTEDDDEYIRLDCDQYVDIWLFFVRLGEPAAKVELDHANATTIRIGGYGLFGA